MADSSRLARAQHQEAEDSLFRSPLALVAGLILFMGVLGVLVVAFTGGDDDGGDTAAVEVPAVQEAPAATGFGGVDVPEIDVVTLTGTPLPPFGQEETDPAVGMLMPEITATSLANGSPITLDTGRARVIGFFAHWCPHCQDELPEVTEWLTDTRLPPNTEFIAVSTAVDEGRGNYPPSDWFNEVGFNAPVLIDDADNTLLNGLGFAGFPAFVAVDASGVVVARAGGNVGTEGLEALFASFAA